jgi:hypothetical protein
MIRSVACLVLLVAVLANCANAFVAPAKPTTRLSSVNSAGPFRHPVSIEASSSSNDAVLIEKDFRLSGIFLTGGLLLDQVPYIQWTLGPLITLLGVLFLVQTFRLKFVCDSKSFFLENASQESGENIIVGGENRWTYSSFVNYEFFPEGWIDLPQGPILVYFKETQTQSEKWTEGPGGIANSEEALTKGVTPGQVHFFPALCNTKQLRAEWEKRGCNKL